MVLDPSECFNSTNSLKSQSSARSPISQKRDRKDPLEALKENPFVLAPMAGITDHAFRSFMKKRGAGVVITELVSATGIKYESDRTLNLMSFDSTQSPIGIQLFGEDPEVLAHAAQVVEERGADFVDLNFGCPVPKVVKKGAGSAMLKDLVQMQKVLRAVKMAVKIPVTIKIRTGWDAQTRNAVDVCQLAFDEGITWVAIHGRTRAQGYSGQADWDFISDVRARSKIAILGNGDLTSAQLSVKRLKESGCQGVMIGRGALKNPFIFEESLALWRELEGQGSQDSKDSQDRIDSPGGQDDRKHQVGQITLGGRDVGINKNMADLFLELESYIVAHCEPHLISLQMKKFASWYSAGYPGASQFRKQVFQTKSHDEIMSFALEFFGLINKEQQEDTSQEEFLMGGHG